MRVAGGGDIALGFVHEDVHLLLALEALAVETDVVVQDVHLGAQLGDDLPVHGDHAALDERIGLPAGADAGVGDELVQADDLLDRGLHGIVVGVAAAAHLGLAAEHGAHAGIGLGALRRGLAGAGTGPERGLAETGLAGPVSVGTALAVGLALAERLAFAVRAGAIGLALPVGAAAVGLAVAERFAVAGRAGAVDFLLTVRTVACGAAAETAAPGSVLGVKGAVRTEF